MPSDSHSKTANDHAGLLRDVDDVRVEPLARTENVSYTWRG